MIQLQQQKLDAHVMILLMSVGMGNVKRTTQQPEDNHFAMLTNHQIAQIFCQVRPTRGKRYLPKPATKVIIPISTVEECKP